MPPRPPSAIRFPHRQTVMGTQHSEKYLGVWSLLSLSVRRAQEGQHNMRILRKRRATWLVALVLAIAGLSVACEPAPDTEGDVTVDEGTPVAPCETATSATEASGWGANYYVEFDQTIITDNPGTEEQTTTVVNEPAGTTACGDPTETAPINLAYTNYGTPSAGGCKDVEMIATGKSWPLGLTLFRWHYKKHWCWIRPYIGSKTVSAQIWVTNVDALWSWDSVVSTQFYFYDSYRGHKGYRQDKMHGVCYIVGCFYAYPWAWVRSHGDGTWTRDRGVG